MHTLTQFRLCPQSRAIRIALAEIDIEAELSDERPWDLQPSFLALNPAGELPVLQLDRGPILCGAYAISEYMAEEVTTHPRDGRSVPIFPGTREDRAEVRRLVDWFNGKLNREVTYDLLFEKIYVRVKPVPGHVPNREVMQALRASLRYHLSYIAHLADRRRWLAGDELSFADICAAAQMSVLDYLGDVPWDEQPVAKAWYQRMKSRPSFRSVLADRLPGVAPPDHYANLDF